MTGGGTWLPLVEACSSVNQIDATIACYLPTREAADEWANVPTMNQRLIMSGTEINVFARKVGAVKGYPGEENLQKRASFLSTVWINEVSALAELTVDDLTRMGSVAMMQRSTTTEYLSDVQAAVSDSSVEAGKTGLVDLDPKGKAQRRKPLKLAYAVDLTPVDDDAE
eukprot:SAG31_NODE_4253_length_3415_cov_1.433655_2_plen_168_part_00